MELSVPSRAMFHSIFKSYPTKMMNCRQMKGKHFLLQTKRKIRAIRQLLTVDTKVPLYPCSWAGNPKRATIHAPFGPGMSKLITFWKKYLLISWNVQGSSSVIFNANKEFAHPRPWENPHYLRPVEWFEEDCHPLNGIEDKLSIR